MPAPSAATSETAHARVTKCSNRLLKNSSGPQCRGRNAVQVAYLSVKVQLEGCISFDFPLKAESSEFFSTLLNLSKP